MYSTARLSDEELLPESGASTPAPKRWRLAALAVGVVGAVGAVVGVAWPQKRLTRMQRMSAMTQRFITAFTARELNPLEKLFSQTLDFALLEDGAPEDWEQMKISAHIAQSDAEVENPQIKMVIIPGEADPPLKDLLEAVKKSITEEVQVKFGDEAGDIFSHLVQIQEEGDDVAITVTIPKQFLEKEMKESESTDKEVVEALKKMKPEFKASISFGKKLSEIFDGSDEDCPVTMFGGVRAHIETTLAKKFIHGMEAAYKETEQTPPEESELDHVMSAMQVLSSVTESFTAVYRKEELNEACGRMEVPNRGMLMNIMAMELEGKMDADVRGAIKKLKDHTNGLKTIELRGLPEKWEVVMSFEHFRVAKMLSSFVDKMQEREDQRHELLELMKPEESE